MKENKLRKGTVLFRDAIAGVIEETASGYKFTYDNDFIKKGIPLSFSLPIKEEPYESNRLFSFFCGLLPEGWYLDIICSKLKIDKEDKFGILLATCKDTVGAVSVKEEK